MRIRYTRHALLRMRERYVPKSEIYYCLAKPDKRVKKDGNYAALKMRKNGHLLIVIYTGDKYIFVVITVIDTSKVNKYL